MEENQATMMLTRWGTMKLMRRGYVVMTEGFVTFLSVENVMRMMLSLECSHVKS